MIDRTDIGRCVQDAYGRTGILRDIDPAWEDPSDPPGGRADRRWWRSSRRSTAGVNGAPTSPPCNGCESRLALSRPADLRGAEWRHEPIGGR
ncbi:hypothetical protein GCM10010425_22800 [Streptomyces spororaveus]